MSEYLLTTEQVCEAYAELRVRVTEMMSGISHEKAQTIVPHCPKWTVKDCLAHMVGVPEDVINGQMDGVATEAWTDRQVQRHSQNSVADLLSIWEKNAPVFATILPRIPQPVISQFMFDQTTHEQDIRKALGQPGARETLAISVAEGFLRDSFSRREDPAIVQLAKHELSGFEYLRTLSGRRSRSQLLAYGFDPVLIEHLFATMPFDIPKTDVSDD